MGKIIEKREPDDGQNTSFVVKMENGYEAIRHKSHIRHNVKRYSLVDETKVRFRLQEDVAKDITNTDQNAVKANAEGHYVGRR